LAHQIFDGPFLFSTVSVKYY